jgi:predicted acetyltransferase
MALSNDVERFRDYVFVAPPDMRDGDLVLELARTHPYNPQKGYVPAYEFAMVHAGIGAVMGQIDLRVGLTQKLKILGGHIGYEVDEPFRGHRYAARSCRLLLPFARSLGISPVLITCDPANIASVKTIESLGAELLDTYEVEIEPGVVRWTNRYQVE